MTVKLGRTGLVVNKTGFGALPVQRRTVNEAVRILRGAFDAGINYFDTARMYTDSEEKIGLALGSVREQIIIATKNTAANGREMRSQLETSLGFLKTDYIDVYQFHNHEKYPRPDDGTGLYEAMLEAKQAGKVRFIGITNHRIDVAFDAVRSGLYDTMQFPFSYISGEKENGLVKLCAETGTGFIAMKALCGGLLNDIGAASAFMNTQSHVVPIWGIQSMDELEELKAAMQNEGGPNPAQSLRIERDRAELRGTFCRSCGYCLPCPAGIPIFNCARMSLLLRRSPPAQWLTEHWRREMEKIRDCEDCGHCREHCPYGIDAPALLKKNYEDYQTFLREDKLCVESQAI
ncbi:MAG: aldo/keto reductase [Spirochaetaceae bacterium]|jgi:aryl-alcohol dehydrogenase-like predicted oxidoreductase|nr:aldo/keto reductase [Spirochaetaceae bacterium]